MPFETRPKMAAAGSGAEAAAARLEGAGEEEETAAAGDGENEVVDGGGAGGAAGAAAAGGESEEEEDVFEVEKILDVKTEGVSARGAAACQRPLPSGGCGGTGSGRGALRAREGGSGQRKAAAPARVPALSSAAAGLRGPGRPPLPPCCV